MYVHTFNICSLRSNNCKMWFSWLRFTLAISSVIFWNVIYGCCLYRIQRNYYNKVFQTRNRNNWHSKIDQYIPNRMQMCWVKNNFNLESYRFVDTRVERPLSSDTVTLIDSTVELYGFDKTCIACKIIGIIIQ